MNEKQIEFAATDELQVWQSRAEAAERQAAIEADRRKAAEAEADRLRHRAKIADEVEQITFTEHCKLAERLTLIGARYRVGREAAGNSGDFVEVRTQSATTFAKALGLSTSTVTNALHRLQERQVVEYKSERIIVDDETRHVAPLSIKPDHQTGDLPDGYHWEATSSIATVATLPTKIPKLADKSATPRERATRATAQEVRSLAQIARELQSMACPECGTVGELHIACESCGTVFDAAGLAENTPVESFDTSSDTTEAPEIAAIDATEPPEINATTATDTPVETFDNPAPVQNSNISLNRANFGRGDTVGALSAACGESYPPLDMASGDILTGKEAIEFWGDLLGDVFCKVQPALPTEADGKEAIGDDYWRHPLSTEAALAHYDANPRHQNNIGVCAGKVSGVPAFDVDFNRPALLDALARIAARKGHDGPLMPLYLDRANDGDRIKVPFVLDGDEADIAQYMRCDVNPKDKSKTPTAKAEVLATGKQFVVAGVHKSGAPLRTHVGELFPLTPAEVGEIMRAIVPHDPRDDEKPKKQHKQVSQPALSAPTSWAAMNMPQQKHAAVDELNTDPQFNAMVDALLLRLKKQGQYISIRANDDHPSTLESTDGYYKRTWHDFGTGETYDAFELWLLLTGKDKQVETERVYNECRARHGSLPVDEAIRRGKEKREAQERQAQRQKAMRAAQPAARALKVAV